MSLVPIGWRPITVNPADTARGLAFLAGMSLLYAAVFREFDDERWRRRLAGTVVLTACVMTLAALVQAASAEPTRIYGLWKPQLGLGRVRPLREPQPLRRIPGHGDPARPRLRRGVRPARPALLGTPPVRLGGAGRAGGHRRHPARRGGDGPDGRPAGLALARRAAGLWRGVAGPGRAAAPLARAAPAAGRRDRGDRPLLGGRGRDPDARSRPAACSRAGSRSGTTRSRMFPRFPVLGAGFNAFGTSYTQYQTIARYEWYGEAHNEYLQALLDLGIVGAAAGGGAARAAAAGRRAGRGGDPARRGDAGRHPRLLRPQRGGLQLADPGQRGDLCRARGRHHAPGRVALRAGDLDPAGAAA